MKHFGQRRVGWPWRCSEARARPATRAERGQALLLIAVAMIGLLAFIGLTIDAGILFIGMGHLRRAVDAAALAAAGQFRIGRTHDQLKQSADEVVHMNGVDPTTLVLTLCDPTDAAYDEPTVHPGSTLCQGTIHRKLVRVEAWSHVQFAFLGIIGFPGTDIVSSATSEAASLDVVLVIDTSNSMTTGIAGEIKGGWKSDGYHGDPMWYPGNPADPSDPLGCNDATPADPLAAAQGFTGNCLPFLYVKEAAAQFVSHLYWPYDRLSLVTFDNVPNIVLPLTNTLTLADWVNTIKTLNVSPPRDRWAPGSPCTYEPYNPPVPPEFPAPYQPDPSACTNTSIGGGLKLAGGEFGRPPIRQEAVWVVILLTDGAANASEPNAGTGQINKFCPQATWWDQANDPRLFNPFCRDTDPATRHTIINPATYAGIDPGHATPYNPSSTYDASGIHYDAEDYARDNADFVSCPAKLAQAPKWCRDSLDYLHNQGGQGALLFSIGLGGLVIDTPQGGGTGSPEVRINPSDPHASYNAGDTLLRYLSNVGMDGNPDPNDPNSPDPCQGVSAPGLIPQPDPDYPKIPPGNLSYNCGNYYFSQFGTGLSSVFQSIASRIFTRLTQ